MNPLNLDLLPCTAGLHPHAWQGDTIAPSDGCGTELVSWMAGEPWSDHPACLDPTIGAFIRCWWDGLPTPEDRRRLIGPRLDACVGTNTGTADAERRAWMAADWLVRVHTVAWCRLVPSLAAHADALAALPELTDDDSFSAAMPVVAAARDAAGAAARDAARDAAWAAARDAAWDAAWAAAWDAAGDAAGAAARAAAGDAAWAAAWAAAGDALAPTVAQLQASAADLLDRMVAS